MSASDEIAFKRRREPLFVNATVVQSGGADERVLDLAPAVRFLTRHLWLVGGGALLVAALCVGFSYRIPRTYRAEVLIEPIVGGAATGLAGVAAGLGGVAGLLGVDIGGNGSSTAASLAVMQSRQLVTQFIAENKLTPVLLPRVVRPDWWPFGEAEAPTLEDAFQSFSKSVMSVTQDKKGGLVTVAIEWRDRQLAASWANEMVAKANQYIAEQAASEADRNIAYLTAEAARSAEVGLRQAIYSLIESEIKKRMLARTRPDYAFRVLDAAAPPKFPIGPRRIYYLFAGGVLGGGLSVLIGWYVDRRRTQKQRALHIR